VRPLARRLRRTIRTNAARRRRERRGAWRGRCRTFAAAGGRGIARLALADELLIAFVALTRLVAAMVARADEFPLALAPVARLLDAFAIVADDFLVAILALTLGIETSIAFADNKLITRLTSTAVFRATRPVFADDTLAVATTSGARHSGGTVVAVAENGFLFPLILNIEHVSVFGRHWVPCGCDCCHVHCSRRCAPVRLGTFCNGFCHRGRDSACECREHSIVIAADS
jgi:hypothetical protein